MKKINTIYDKISANLGNLTQDGAIPVTAETIAEWLINERDKPCYAEDDTTWLAFAYSLRMGRGSKPDYASRQKVNAVMNRLHNKCRCAMFRDMGGGLRWSIPQPLLNSEPSVKLPSLQTAYRIAARLCKKNSGVFVQEYIVLADTAVNARVKLRSCLLMADTEDECIIQSMNVLATVSVLG